MTKIDFTDAQNSAIHTTGKTVIVSAAAGSGKTAVLAERCAYLVCEVPTDARCNVGDLLVLTFTDAAASQMRRRIAESIRRRLQDDPGNSHLRGQLALIDAAQISTIHAYCLWIIRRWFAGANIDPAAQLLDADESYLLQHETLDEMFSGLYAASSKPAKDFAGLVEDYGLGRDEQIGLLILSLADFVESLPAPDDWLDASRLDATRIADLLDENFRGVKDEINRQLTEARRAVDFIRTHAPGFEFYSDRIGAYAVALEEWSERLQTAAGTIPPELRAEMESFQLTARGAPRVGKDFSTEQVPLRDMARDLFDQVRSKLLARLQSRYARFSDSDWREGLQRVGPYVDTIVSLVGEFRRRYKQAKQLQAAVDFADLERGAFDVLCTGGDTSKPSDVARCLQERFAHVLIDEFQDINPLQEAILRFSSRSSSGGANNMFAVGDIKQSIYRFRLAEPQIFLDAVDRADAHPDTHSVIFMQKNFRSQPQHINGVNRVFERLMTRAFGGVDYDVSSTLHLGREDAEAVPIQVHLLHRAGRTADTSDSDAEDLTSFEREAYLIGTHIECLIAEGKTYSDVVILLRSVSHKAESMAGLLSAMGIPVYADVGTGYFEATEVNDVLSLLTLLDNDHQDIPLAAVLRSGLLGGRFDESDLVALRCHGPDMPFHAAVRQYAAKGKDASLRDRLGEFYRRLDVYRQEARRRPLADVLWRIYQETGYLAYVGGLPSGLQRRANLLQLHQRARQFGTFTRQGLHRFLRFLETLKEQGQDLGTAPAVGEGENVVRVMSIHRSKGLEFPVVFLADLGKQFNLSDARSRMIYDRNMHIGLKVVDPQNRIEYPSLAHHLVRDRIEHDARQEELRILYVAMTRARDRLFLVGSCDLDKLDGVRRMWRQHNGPLPRHVLDTAAAPLDWLLPALACQDEQTVQWLADADEAPNDQATFQVMIHAEDELASWQVGVEISPQHEQLLQAVADLQPLGAQPVTVHDEQVERVIERLDFVYPHLMLGSLPAVVPVSEIKRRHDVFVEPDARRPTAGRTSPKPKFLSRELRELSAVEYGLATHTVLEQLDLSQCGNRAEIERQIADMQQRSLLTPIEAAAVDVDALDWFFQTDLGRAAIDAGERTLREAMFLTTVAPQEYDPDVSSDHPHDQLLLRGQIDLLIPHADGFDLVDFKTDRIDKSQVAQANDRYRVQIDLYARAVERIWKRPVRGRFLVYLHPRVVASL